METVLVELKLRKADSADLKETRSKLKLGQPLWIKGRESGKFDNKPYIISEDSDLIELSCWLQEDMIWVPASDLDLTENEA